MASSKEYLNFILEQLSGLEDITHRAMMGEYAREEKYDEAIFIENNDSVVIHDIKSGYTNRCPIFDVCYTGRY